MLFFNHSIVLYCIICNGDKKKCYNTRITFLGNRFFHAGFQSKSGSLACHPNSIEIYFFFFLLKNYFIYHIVLQFGPTTVTKIRYKSTTKK